ncbi:hypothetical protein TIFTF001_027075 [Ficus carica]|uniref:Strictosidine synthase conserved region domain-containing protein n=1 Tax=Ficus carica TaxID=3494 RepID=A0AA88IZ31_FICCA|nr:hypothetical protein TIFTF001_027075 [Ficus carica]
MLFAIFVLLFSLPSVVLSNSDELESFERLDLPGSSRVPYSLAFEKSLSREFFTGISDGRIVKFNKDTNSFQDYATTTPRSKAECDGIDRPRPTCGRPLGLDFYEKTGELFFTDQYRGLQRVGRNGGPATQIASTADGTPLTLINDISVNQLSGEVYFTQASTIRGPISGRPLDEALEALPERDTTGRLLKYDPRTEQVTVLLDDLAGASRVELSHNGRYALVSEYLAKRIRKVYLGDNSKPLQYEVFVEGLEGRPFSIERPFGNDFYVAVSDIKIVEGPRPGPGPGPRPPRRIEITPKAVKINEDVAAYPLFHSFPANSTILYQKSPVGCLPTA